MPGTTTNPPIASSALEIKYENSWNIPFRSSALAHLNINTSPTYYPNHHLIPTWLDIEMHTSVVCRAACHAEQPAALYAI
jgi:hypothetical protein